ncbi:glycosyltransferase family A protein [Rhodocytophaga aerolata]|uniref:Glycosyltransferase family A protein n=1 Tax=Rhodocytophaga aerolata TaxID=455078 RepID=A0ABT8RCG7_9BACT|nr:glycosyltransferase family A protein [Rhodocytophaga aerolata]MDO1449797.1 glycosyltransferase family A protein [Rhodocytophaga aerolata]
MNPVTLQISLTPNDYKHSFYLLEHQLQTWSTQVSEILLIYDSNKSNGRFGKNWEETNLSMLELIQLIKKKYPNIVYSEVDYSPECREIVSKFFFKGLCPKKDFRGGPFYAYFYGIYKAKYDYVFHIDSDTFFGGQSSTWLSEALELMQKYPKILITSPLPGPPHPDHILIDQFCIKSSLTQYAFEFTHMSTRLFLIDRRKLYNNLKIMFPNIRSILKAIFEDNPPYALPEEVISRFMLAEKFIRIDLKGASPGMWSVHPPFRTATFYTTLPQLIVRITKNDVTPDQMGFYDITDSMCDWTEARNKLKKERWWKKLFNKLILVT